MLFFSKVFRWQLTSIVPSAADIVDNADKKKLFHSALNPIHCLHNMLPPITILTVDFYASMDMVEYYLWQKPNVTRTSSLSGVYIAMLSISQALCYSLRIFTFFNVQQIDFLIMVNNVLPFVFYYYFFLL